MDAIRRIVRALRQASQTTRREVGLNGAQVFVLQKLAGERAISVNELSERTLTHQSTVSVVVQRLVDKGLVQRSRSASDGRRLELALTVAGRKVLRQTPNAAQEQIVQALHRMGDEPRGELAALLTRLVQLIGLDDQHAGLFFEEETHEPAKTIRRTTTRKIPVN
ncbi:MAG: winged helix-turn-helix transcriptional regulator [Phycisphaerales bacterium]|nr:winged helix-turn-helix transcriptional regulator [Phycisphaerales bacterium]